MNNVTLEIRIISFDFDIHRPGSPNQIFSFENSGHKIYFRKIDEYLLPTMDNCSIKLYRKEKLVDVLHIVWIGGHADIPTFHKIDENGFFSKMLQKTENVLCSFKAKNLKTFQDGDVIIVKIQNTELSQEKYAQKFFMEHIT